MAGTLPLFTIYHLLVGQVEERTKKGGQTWNLLQRNKYAAGGRVVNLFGVLTLVCDAPCESK